MTNQNRCLVCMLHATFWLLFCWNILVSARYEVGNHFSGSALNRQSVGSNFIFELTDCRFKFYFSKHHPHFVILPNQTDWLSEIWFLIPIKTVPYNWVVPTQIKADERPRARHEMKPTTTHPSNYHPSIFIKNKVRKCLFVCSVCASNRTALPHWRSTPSLPHK